jgi:hypothetical protein
MPIVNGFDRSQNAFSSLEDSIAALCCAKYGVIANEVGSIKGSCPILRPTAIDYGELGVRSAVVSQKYCNKVK